MLFLGFGQSECDISDTECVLLTATINTSLMVAAARMEVLPSTFANTWGQIILFFHRQQCYKLYTQEHINIMIPFLFSDYHNFHFYYYCTRILILVKNIHCIYIVLGFIW